MTTIQDPWTIITPPKSAGEINTRLVLPDYPYELFWAVDFSRREMMVMNLSPSTPIPLRLPTPDGFTVSLSPSSPGVPKRLFLRLQSADARGMFLNVCQDLVALVRMQNSEERAARVLIERVARWQAFLRENRSLHLSDEEQRGLIGELLFLEQYALPLLRPPIALACWTDPEAAKDFTFPAVQVEIKTRLSSGRNRVRISGPEQLDRLSLPLFLGVYCLSKAQREDDRAISLFSIADRIANTVALSDPASSDAFWFRLMAAGYLRDDYYDAVHYVSEPVDFYSILDAFPRIVPAQLSDGVVDVAYSVDLARCAPFRSDSKNLLDLLRAPNG